MKHDYYENDIRVNYIPYSDIYNRIISSTQTPKQKAMNSITNVIFNNPATIVFLSD